MEVGDRIRRKDMPNLGIFRITGESKEWSTMFEVEQIVGFSKIRKGLLEKDDDRWEVINDKPVSTEGRRHKRGKA